MSTELSFPHSPQFFPQASTGKALKNQGLCRRYQKNSTALHKAVEFSVINITLYSVIYIHMPSVINQRNTMQSLYPAHKFVILSEVKRSRRIYALYFCLWGSSVRRSFDALTLAQDDMNEKSKRSFWCRWLRNGKGGSQTLPFRIF